MGKRAIKSRNKNRSIKLLIIFTIIIFISIFECKVFAGMTNFVSVSTASKKYNLAALDESQIDPITNDSQEKDDLTDKDYIYLSDMEYTGQSKTGWGNIQKDKNSDGNTIKLRKEGEIVSYPRGMGFHANGQLIYDISKYSDKFTRFISDIGVDASRPEVATIKVQIYVSDDGNNWEKKEVDGLEKILKSANSCVSVDIDIKDKKYLKIDVNMADNTNSSDHCVLGDAKIARETFKPSSEKFESLKKLEEYDKIIKESPSYEDAVAKHNKEILAREFVNRFGYWNLQNLASSDENCNAAMTWIFSDEKILELVIDVGEINDVYSFLNSLGALYHAEFEKIDNDKDEELYTKMMVALSAAYSSERISSPFSFSHLAPSYDVTERFEKMKELYSANKLSKEFKTLEVQLLRMVMQDATREDEAEWFNYWTCGGKSGEYTGVFNNGAFWLSYISPNYNRVENFDASQKSKFDSKYKLTEHNVPFADGTIYRYWMAFEYGGICWNCSRVGQSSYRVNGLPATGIYQPSHEAFVGYGETENGEGYWGMGNNIFGWGRSCTTWGGGNGYRLPLNWGNKTFGSKTVSGSNAGNNAGYIILAQANLNDYDNFIKSSKYNLIANTYENDEEKVKIYEKALEVDNINLDSYDYLIKLYEKMGDKITEDDWLKLANKIIEAYKYFPNAMDDLVGLIKPHIKNSAKIIEIEIKEHAALTEAMNLTKEDNVQYSEIKSLASVILGNSNNPIATFSFDGDKAEEIVIADGYNINWSFSLDGKDGNYTQETNSHEIKLTDEQIKAIDENKDIHIKIDGTQEIYTIDILKAEIPVKDGNTVLYANDDENRVLGTDNTMEWRITEETILGDNYELEVKKYDNAEWTSYAEKTPDLSGYKNIEIRVAATSNYLASDISEEFEFTDETIWLGEYLPDISYIPVSSMKIKEVSTEAVEHAGSADNLLDGNLNTRYHSNWQGNDDKRFVIIELDREFSIARLEYYAAGGGNGKILDGSLYGCSEDEFNEDDQEKSKWDLLCHKQYFPSEYDDRKPDIPKEFDIPDEKIRKVKYIKLVGNTTSGGNGHNWFAGRMIKLYRSTKDDPDPSGVIDYSITKPTQGEVTASVANLIPSIAKVVGDSSHTFKDNGTYTFNFEYSSKDFHNPDAPAVTHKGQATAVVNNIDRKAEAPDVEYSTTTLTNDSVKVTLKPKEDILIIDNGKFSVNEEGKIVKDETGEIIDDFITDSEGNVINPNVEIKENAQGEEKEKNILERAKNKVLDDGTTISSDFEYDFMSNETTTIKFVDRAGNIGEVEIKVDCIDNVAPVGIIEYSTTSATDGNVTASISFAKTDEEGNIVYSEDGEIEEEKDIEILNENESNDKLNYTKGTNTVTFSKNGTFTFKFKDKAGNIGEAEAEVTWIKKILQSKKFKVENNEIRYVEPDTYTVKEFKEELTSEYNISVLDKEGISMQDEEMYVKTGMKVDVNGNIYTVIVSGDVNGDGKLDSADMDKECKHYLGKELLEGYYLTAGDYDENNEISLKDVAKMYSQYNKNITNHIKNEANIETIDFKNQITAYVSTSDLEKNINAIGGTFDYDKNVLTLVNVESESSNWRVDNYEDKFIALRNEASNTNEEIMKLTFDIKDSSKKEIAVNLDNLKISDGNFEEDNNGNVKVTITESKQDVPVESVTIASSSDKFDEETKTATLEVSETISFHTTIMPEHATDTSVKWSIDESDKEYISVDSNGTVTANKITDDRGVKLKATVGDKVDICTIKVIPTKVTEIVDELENNDIYLVEPSMGNGTSSDTSFTIKVTVLPENATDKTLIWSSSDPTVATVNDGVITAVKDNKVNESNERTCTVTVKSNSNSNVSKTYTIHVTDYLVNVNNISIDLQNAANGKLHIGDSLELKLKITPENANLKDVIWEVIEGKNIIKISESGLVHALMEGKAKVRATVHCQEKDCQGHTAEIELEVLPKEKIEVESIKIQGDHSVTLKELAEMQLHALVLPDEATDKTVTWESSNPEIVSVTSDGKLFGEKVGKATITAKAGDKTDSIEVEVVPNLKTDLIVYVMNQNNEFNLGITLRLDKISNGSELRIDEQTTNGKYKFKDLEDGKYILRAYKTSNAENKENTKNDLIIEYEFEIKNGKVLFKKEDHTEVQTNSLVFVIPTEDEIKAKVDNGDDYPDIEKDYQEYIKNLEENSGENPNPDKKPNSNEETNPGDKTNSGGENSGKETNSGEKTDSSKKITSDEKSSMGDNSNNFQNGNINPVNSNTSLPKTSDVSIGKFVIIMFISFIGIICIIYNNKKKHIK